MGNLQRERYRPCFLRIAWVRCSACRSLSAFRVTRPLAGAKASENFEHRRLIRVVFFLYALG